MPQKLKSVLANEVYFLGILLVLVAVASFLLGRVSAGWGGGSDTGSGADRVFLATSTMLIPLQPATAALAPMVSPDEPTAASNTNLPIVASKSGTKYHLVSCASASRIKDTNRIYFASATEAESAGYTKAANCPGL
jgi:hypothetical protein